MSTIVSTLIKRRKAAMPHAPETLRPKPWTIALLLCVIGASSHLLPHPAGISTVGAIGMLAAAYLPRHLLPLPVLVSVATVDAINGTYHITAMALVYAAHLLSATGVAPILRQVRVLHGKRRHHQRRDFLPRQQPVAAGHGVLSQHSCGLADLLCGWYSFPAARHRRESDLWRRCFRLRSRLMVHLSTLGALTQRLGGTQA